MREAVQLITSELIQQLIARARAAPRLRINHNFHASMEENPHRFLNVLIRGSYIAPHRHLHPPKAESFLALQGELAFFTFDGAGEVTSTHVLGRDAIGIDVQPGIWHTIAVLSPLAVCYEVKPGPYLASTDKEFAPWAPAEGDPLAPAYLDRLIAGI